MALNFDGTWHSAVCDVCKDTFQDDDGCDGYDNESSLLASLDDTYWAYDGGHAYCPKHWRLTCAHCGRTTSGDSAALLAEGWLHGDSWYCPVCVEEGYL